MKQRKTQEWGLKGRDTQTRYSQEVTGKQRKTQEWGLKGSAQTK